MGAEDRRFKSSHPDHYLIFIIFILLLIYEEKKIYTAEQVREIHQRMKKDVEERSKLKALQIRNTAFILLKKDPKIKLN